MSHSRPTGRPANRLAGETSPYLQQHAYNPVDWFPWGEEAFEKAKREDKPIFLSVGYSACHWCHVMERESFENEEIARFLNEHYVSIKVDREERPDVDQIYMSAVQLITRRGGWPMSVFLTPESKPFYGGTYWPPRSSMGMPGFLDILKKLQNYWSSKRDEVETSADQLVEAIHGLAAPLFEEVDLSEETLRQATRDLIQSADRIQGGFGSAPKFPHPMDLRVLLRGWDRFGDEDALNVVRLTLTKMARGGIYDHLGGGFHRYSTDARWLVPHFEKMLYDNALLVPAYLEMFQCTQETFFAQVARETLDYVLREMTSPEGGFYSTQDADSEGVEGKFFVWTEAETRAILGPDDAAVFNACYDVSARGNWEEHSILNLPRPQSDVAKSLQLEPVELERILSRSRQKLLAARSRRIAPGRDEKVLSGWNGMMISAFAQGASILNQPQYLEAAQRAADFVLSQMKNDPGELLHSYKDGRARFQGYVDDYACMIDGLVDLFQAGSDPQFLEAAIELSEDAIRRFQDDEIGGFFYTANDHEELITRTKDSQDNAIPSGNGMMATALARLGRITGRGDLEEAARKTLAALSGLLAEHPRASGQALLALDFLLGPTSEVVIVDAGDGKAAAFQNEVWKRFLPRKVVVSWSANRPVPPVLELLEGKTQTPRSRFYLCERGACQSPCESPSEAASQIDALRRT
ncbi:thioredoxin domain-containing protein [Planctomicrobium sp. SH661]|uniref:thioredoxin domain-containing protein n=1 Tax=Planctomicrobium sp. SH661 TaxID=3448124 RepID=UPI003F5AF343